MNKKILIGGLAASVIALTSGCATTQTYHETNDAYNSTNNNLLEKFKKEQERLKRENVARNQPRVLNMTYVDTKKIPIQKELPSEFRKHYVFNPRRSMDVRSILSSLSSIANVPMSVESDFFSTPKQNNQSGGNTNVVGGNDSTGNSQSQQPQVINLGGSGMNQGLGGMGQQQLSADKQKYSVSAKGTLKQILDSVAASLSAHWRYDDKNNRVVFYKYVTRTYTLNLLPGDFDNKVAMNTKGSQSSTGSSSSNQGGASSNLSFDSKSSNWSAVESSINDLMSDTGRMTVSPSTGMIVVRDTPDVQDSVAQYIKKVNDIFGRQVSVRVQVYKVLTNNSDDRGIDWKNVVLQSQRLGLGLALDTSTFGQISNLPSGVTSMVLTPKPNDNITSAGALVQSLSRLGKVSNVTSTEVQTVNNEPAPVRVSKTTSYLESTSVTVQANAGSTTQMNPGTLDTGFSMQVLPHITNDGKRMLMQVMLSLSSLDTMQTVSSPDGTSTIQLPTTSSRDFVQRAWLKSGQSLVLAGFKSTDTTDNSGGVVDAKAWYLGGSRSVSKKNESIVIVITPVITSNVAQN